MDQPQVNPENVINILRIRLQDEIYQRALLEAAYNQQKEQLDQTTRELDQLRRQATNQHTQLSQELEKNPWTHPYPQQTDTTTTTQAKPQETDATPADTSQKQPDTKSP